MSARDKAGRAKALRLHRKLMPVWASDARFRGRFSTSNNNDIGGLFLIVATTFFVVGGILALLIRPQLASSGSAFMGPEAYNQVFTMHGTIMMFLFAIPFFEALAVLLLPGMLGTRDLAFPRLGAFGLWVSIFGGSAVLIAMVLGLAPDGGWFMYPPLSSAAFSPGIGPDVWLMGITSIEVSAIAAAVEVVVTILRYRAAGMTLGRMPIFAWYMLVVAVMILTAFPPMILGSLLLEVEWAFGWPFFQAKNGGDPLLWQHLFWRFGHPEVYIIFLPAAGMIGTILPVMARTTLLGHGWEVAAAITLAVLSFGLWVHHMFTTGIPHLGLAFFSAASTLVAVPTAVMIFAWIGTLWKGRPRMELPMLWLMGRSRFFKLGEIAFWITVPAFHLTFLAMHWVGLLGQRRRTWTYAADQGWDLINLTASIGAFAMAIGFALVIVDIAVNTLVARPSRRNPWNAPTLEWAVMLPSPAYGFASIPVVQGRYPLQDDPDLALRIARGEGMLAEPLRNRRETLIVSTTLGTPLQVAVLPGNSRLPFLLAIVTSTSFLAPLVGAYALSVVALVGVVILAMVWAWTLGGTADQGLLDAGHGHALPSSWEVPDPPGWWGSLMLLVADSVHFGSLLFGYAFLWTVGPNWLPPSYLVPGLTETLLLLTGAVALVAGPRLAVRAIQRQARPWTALAMAAAGALGLAAAAVSVVRARPNPAGHAYDATLWLLAGHVGLHVTIILIMLGYLAARVRAGYVSPRRIGEVRIVQLWADFTAITAGMALAAAWLPGVFG